MFGNIADQKIAEPIEMSDEWEDDPRLSSIMVFGQENGGTTTLAASVVDLIDEDKKVYVLLTEMPHNFGGIVKKHYPKEWAAGKFVVPTTEFQGRKIPRPITTRDQFILWCAAVKKKPDLGAAMVDSLDSLREVLFKYHDKKNPAKGTFNYGSANGDIIQYFYLEYNFLGIPIVVVLKEKGDTQWITETDSSGRERLKEVKKILNPDGTQKIVPTVDADKILQQTTIRLHCTEKGMYTVTKSKSVVEEGEEFRFTFEGNSNTKRTGIWLKQLLEKMEGAGDDGDIEIGF